MKTSVSDYKDTDVFVLSIKVMMQKKPHSLHHYQYSYFTWLEYMYQPHTSLTLSHPGE